MHRPLALFLLAVASAFSADRARAQARWTDTQKIANAVTAAPRFISNNAAIMDRKDGKMVTLRAGTNGWTCMPTDPAKEGNEPMCLDDQWMSFINALMTRPHRRSSVSASAT